jgi:hypothetical protein
MTMPVQPQPPAAPAPPEPGAPGTITVPVTDPAQGAFDPRTGDPVQPAPATDPNGVWGQGVIPATPPAPNGAVAPPVAQPAPVPAAVAAPGTGTPIQPVVVDGVQYFTAEALEEARRQEREKLYGRLEEQGTQLRAVNEFVEQEKQRREQAEREAAEAAERERQAGLTVEQRLEEMQRTFTQQLAQRDEQLAMQQAVMARENALREVESYKARRVAEESDLIHPALLANITGTTNEEIEQSIAAAKGQTDAIVQDMQGQQVAQRQQMRTVAPTGAPPVGPSDNASGQQTYTAEDIQRMDNATYAKHRGALLQAASARAAQGALYQP